MQQRLKTLRLFVLGIFLFFPLMASAQIQALFHNGQDPVIGNPRGNVTVVEFFDYQCSHCIDFASTLNSFIRSNPNVRVVFKEFPIRGYDSEVASRAALAAQRQGKYYAMHQALFATNRSLSVSTVTDIAKNLGLNIDKFKKDMESASVNNQIRANLQLGNVLDIPGTPAFFIAKTNVKNMKDVEYTLGELSSRQLKKLVEEA